MIRLHLVENLGDPGGSLPPVLRLGLGSFLARTERIEASRAFAEIEGIGLSIDVTSLRAADAKPARVGHRKADKLLTMAALFDPLGVPVAGDGVVPMPSDQLKGLADTVAAALARVSAWAERKGAWADRAHFEDGLAAALDLMRRGELTRPYEFTTEPRLKAALDAAWALVEAEPRSAERLDAFASAYLALRDAGWEAAEYEIDPSGQDTRWGPLARVANAGSNIASSAPPSAEIGYTML